MADIEDKGTTGQPSRPDTERTGANQDNPTTLLRILQEKDKIIDSLKTSSTERDRLNESQIRLLSEDNDHKGREISSLKDQLGDTQSRYMESSSKLGAYRERVEQSTQKFDDLKVVLKDYKSNISHTLDHISDMVANELTNREKHANRLADHLQENHKKLEERLAVLNQQHQNTMAQLSQKQGEAKSFIREALSSLQEALNRLDLGAADMSVSEMGLDRSVIEDFNSILRESEQSFSELNTRIKETGAIIHKIENVNIQLSETPKLDRFFTELDSSIKGTTPPPAEMQGGMAESSPDELNAFLEEASRIDGPEGETPDGPATPTAPKAEGDGKSGVSTEGGQPSQTDGSPSPGTPTASRTDTSASGMAAGGPPSQGGHPETGGLSGDTPRGSDKQTDSMIQPGGATGTIEGSAPPSGPGQGGGGYGAPGGYPGQTQATPLQGGFPGQGGGGQGAPAGYPGQTQATPPQGGFPGQGGGGQGAPAGAFPSGGGLTGGFQSGGRSRTQQTNMPLGQGAPAGTMVLDREGGASTLKPDDDLIMRESPNLAPYNWDMLPATSPLLRFRRLLNNAKRSEHLENYTKSLAIYEVVKQQRTIQDDALSLNILEDQIEAINRLARAQVSNNKKRRSVERYYRRERTDDKRHNTDPD